MFGRPPGLWARRLGARGCDVRDGGRRPDRPADGLPGFLDELRWRGLFHDATPGLAARLATGRQIAAYNGFDPSGASLHIGHLVPITALAHLQQRGGRPVVLVGGGTGMIGDPSGTSAERNLLDRETLEANLVGIRPSWSGSCRSRARTRPSW